MLHPKDNRPIVSFETAKDFELWLKKNHKTAEGMWVRFYKKASGVASITYREAVDVALCYGWIDAVANKFDGQSYIQRFTPRRAKSLWSKINVEKVRQLIEAGRMKSAGLKQIDAAKADGRWQEAYEPPSNTAMPEDFLLKLSKNAKAKKFFDTRNCVAIANRKKAGNTRQANEYNY